MESERPRGRPRHLAHSTGILFTLGAAVGLAAAGRLNLHLERPLYEPAYETVFVVIHGNLLWVAPVLQLAFAVIYFAFPRLTRGSYRETLGHLHFWLTTIAIVIIASAPYVVSRILLERSWSGVAEEYLIAGPIFLLLGQVPFFLLFTPEKVKPA